MSRLAKQRLRSGAAIAVSSVSVAVLFSLALAFAVPALVAALQSFVPGSGSAFRIARIWQALRFTLIQASLSALVAVIIGLPAAFLAARRNFPGRRLLLSLSGVPLCVPPVVIALAFVLFYGRQGYLNTLLMRIFGLSEPPVTFLYSLAGVVLAHGFYNFPVVLRTVSQVWERLSESEEEAAQLLGAGRLRVFLTVILPRLSSAILTAAALVFLYCFFSFVIVLLFGGVGGTTLEVELYRAARSSLDYSLAGSIALTETAAALVVVAVYLWLRGHLARGSSGLKSRRLRLPLQPGGERLAAVAYLLFIVLFFIGPLVSILVRSFLVAGRGAYTNGLVFSLAAWKSLLSRPSFTEGLRNTIAVGLSVSVLSTVAALAFSLAGMNSRRRPSFGGSLFRSLPMAPLAVSSVMLGFGWTLLVPRGNVGVLILAQSAMAWPFAWTQIQASLDRIPEGVHEAASLLSPRRLDAVFRVLIPLVLPGILSGAGFAFAISVGDASLPLILSLREFENLALTLFRLAGSYRFAEACACATVIAALSALVFFFRDGERGKGADGE